jgi:hypothetical protein
MIYAQVRANCGAVLQKSRRGAAVTACDAVRAGLVVGLPSARSGLPNDAARPPLHEHRRRNVINAAEEDDLVERRSVLKPALCDCAGIPGKTDALNVDGMPLWRACLSFRLNSSIEAHHEREAPDGRG